MFALTRVEVNDPGLDDLIDRLALGVAGESAQQASSNDRHLPGGGAGVHSLA